MEKIYLGDSTYASVENGMVCLTTENGLPEDPSNKIYMEPTVIGNFVTYLKSLGYKI